MYQIQDRKIQSPVRACNKCSAGIVWLRTANYKKIPINAATFKDGDRFYDSVKHVNHFATCKGNVQVKQEMKLAHKLAAAVDKACRHEEDLTRGTHIGAGSLGKKCSRELWYGFRWADIKDFPPNVVRLFARGHREEAVFENMLLRAGLVYWPHDPATGKQYVVTFRNRHVKGYSDGKGVDLPDLPPGTEFLGEFKTHNLKSFNDLTKQGVEKSKPVHYTQMQLYMHDLKLPWALYGAVCKNDDKLHWELIEYNKAHAVHHLERADLIVSARTPPARISNNPGWYECRFCDFHSVCHKGKPMQETCRSCVHLHPLVDGRWWCGEHDEIRDTAYQRTGCIDHVLI